MNKSGTLITSALLTFGFAAATLAAPMPQSAAPADAPATVPATETPKPKKHVKKHKKAAVAPATTN